MKASHVRTSLLQGLEKNWQESKAEYGLWDKEPEDKFEMVRVANGVSFRMDRMRALGNSVVPAQIQKAFRILTGMDLTNECENQQLKLSA